MDIFFVSTHWLKNSCKNDNVVSVCSTDLPRAKVVFEPLKISPIPVPVNQAPYKNFSLSLNYAQNLLRNGFWHTPSLQSRLRQWLDLFDTFQPDVILAEHAPSALLAARLAGLKCAAIGTGFSVPPSMSPMPSIQPWFSVPQDSLLKIENEFLALVNPVLEKLGGNPLKVVADIFQDVECFLCTFPELDHYGSRPHKSYYGPIVYSPPQQKPDWPPGKFDKVFLYMRTTNRYLKLVLDQLRQMTLSILAFIPDLTEKELIALQQTNLRITTKPVDLKQAVKECKLMISQGGQILAHSCYCRVCR